jgi:farnesyl-diphosphate farnesyltransferase
MKGVSNIHAPTSVADYRDADDDLAFQTDILQGVSRTFALTIPQLPESLRIVVGNAYLLCRIADTVEDAAEVQSADKQAFSRLFVEVVAERDNSSTFAREFGALLDERTPLAERELIANTQRVVRLTHAFNATQRQALERCVAIMSRGMAEYQEDPSVAGLATQADMDRYCYFVAGVVGEMLTELFCNYCEQLAPDREELLELGVSFGQGLQMTNILKDIWEDRRRGACWLPRETFAQHGIDLATLDADGSTAGFTAALNDLVGVAQLHLHNALTYTLRIPSSETGIRRFCLWAIGMAAMTLRKVHANPDFAHGKDVKISRSTVKGTVLFTSLTVRNDDVLRWGFRQATRSLPPAPASYSRADVSCWESFA